MNKGLIRLLAAASAMAFVCVSQAQVQLICRLKDRLQAAEIAKSYQLALLDRTPGAPFVLYEADSEEHATEVELRMATDARIVWVEEDDEFSTPEEQAAMKGSVYKGTIIPAVGGRNQLYKGNANALQQVNFSKTAAAVVGRSVKVAILDSGLSPNHPYLWEKVDSTLNVVEPGQAPYDVERNLDSNGDGVADSGVGHGTMVAGVIDQFAPTSRFAIARVVDSDGIGTAWWLIRGLAFAVVSGCEVANVSLASPIDLPAMTDVLDWCDAKRLLVVAAVGNSGTDRIMMPARISKVIAVGGLLPDNKKAPFANYDSHCDFSAPATGILSQWFDGRIGEWSGTSFSTPMVAGTIVDGLKLTTRLSPETIRNRIERAGRNIDDLNPNYDGEIGLLLDYRRMRTAIKGGATP